jgi:hypothetical protein
MTVDDAENSRLAAAAHFFLITAGTLLSLSLPERLTPPEALLSLRRLAGSAAEEEALGALLPFTRQMAMRWRTLAHPSPSRGLITITHFFSSPRRMVMRFFSAFPPRRVTIAGAAGIS